MSYEKTTRGASTKLSSTKDHKIVYTNGKTVIIRDINNPSLGFAYSGHAHQVNVARVAPSGYYCASADVQGNVRIWDTSFLTSGFPPTSLEPPILKAEYKTLSGRITDLAWDGESKRIVVVGEGRDRFGHAFQVDTGSGAGEISGHSKVINAVAVRHHRPFRAVTASDDASIILHTGVPFKYEKTIKTHTRFVQDVQYAHDGEHFVSVGADAKAFIYDGKTGDTVAEFTDAHKGSIMAVSWSADGKSFVTSSADCTVKLWDVESKKAVNTWDLGAGIHNQQVGNTWTGAHHHSHDVGIVSLSLGGNLNVFDRRVGDKPSKIIHGPQKAITSGALVAKTFFAGSYDGRVTAFEPNTEAATLEEATGHEGQVNGMNVSDGKVFSVGFDDRLREIDGGKKMFTPNMAVSTTSQPKGVAAGPKEVFVITGNGIQAVSGKEQVFSLPVNYQPSAVTVTIDGKTVAVGGEDQKVYLYDWSGSALREVGKLESNRGIIGALAFTPDGSILASGDSVGKIIVYDVKERKMITSRWAFHSARITSLAWNVDSKHCVSGSLDTHVYVWSLDKPMKNVAIKNAVAGGVSVVAWLDPTTVIGAGADGCVRTWSVKLPGA
ncbi:WD40 repeat-like protein [Tulasnella sp. 331]|nr:WD40 repeat-like protein [Tulasnella sp. 331]KAG8888491.1 WD40 repeat-like protein [Tulasnella sp. 332]